MRPVRRITAEEENFRTEELIPGNPRFVVFRRDPIEPEPVGTIILKAFRIVGYDKDCDGSLMARLYNINFDGEETGWDVTNIGLYPNDGVVVTPKELAEMKQRR